MPSCIYCRRASKERFPSEHVIPKSFGVFRNNLTLRCVCGDCNQYFANHLEVVFARETGESVVRFHYGLRKSLAALPRGRLTAKVRMSGPIYGAKVLLGPDAKTGGMEIRYLPQVAFAAKDSEEWEWYLPEELTSETLRRLVPGSRVKYFFTSASEEEQLRSRLGELGFAPTKHISTDRISPQSEMIARVTYLFDTIMRRCVTKIAFNYLAYTLLEDSSLLLRDNFDVVRAYVRNGTSGDAEIVSVVGGPRLSADSRKGSLVDGHMIGVGWGVNDEIVCNLTIFNAMRYQIVLSQRYQGLWFALSSVHSFDLGTGKATKLPANILVRL